LHYARHVFPGLKSTKNFGLLTLRFGPSTSECSGTGTDLIYYFAASC